MIRTPAFREENLPLSMGPWWSFIRRRHNVAVCISPENTSYHYGKQELNKSLLGSQGKYANCRIIKQRWEDSFTGMKESVVKCQLRWTNHSSTVNKDERIIRQLSGERIIRQLLGERISRGLVWNQLSTVKMKESNINTNESIIIITNESIIKY